MTVIDPKELTATKAQLTKASNYATDLQVLNQEDYNAALEQGKKIKTMLDTVVSRREEITRPLNDALKSTRSLFKPIEDGMQGALDVIRDKMQIWFKEMKRIEAEEKEKIAARVEKGTLKQETGLRKMDEVQSVAKTQDTGAAKATMRTVRKVRVINPDIVPDQYWEMNMVMIRKDALAGVQIPGVEVYEDQELAIS